MEFFKNAMIFAMMFACFIIPPSIAAAAKQSPDETIRILPVAQILRKVEANPQREMAAMAAAGHSDASAQVLRGGSTPHAADSALDKEAVESILKKLESDRRTAESYQKRVSAEGNGNSRFFLMGLVVLLVAAGLIFFYARGKDERGETRLQKSLGAKLIASFSIIVLIFTGMAIYTLISMNGIGGEIAELAEDIIPVTGMVSNIETHQLEQAIALERAFRYGKEEGTHAKEGFEKSVEKFEHFGKEVDQELYAAIKLLEEMPAHSVENAKIMTANMNKLAVINNHHHHFEMIALKAFELLKAGKAGQARMLEEMVEKTEDELNHEMEIFLERLQKRSEESAHKAESDEKKAANIIWIVSILTIVAAFVIAVFNTRSIINPINRVIVGLSEGAEQVASASGQVSTASQSLAEGASEQAASIEETSSSLEEMSSMTRQNADNANQADTLMKEANQVVALANGSMGELTHSMQAISKASEETSKIIKTIDEIAFQTNLLALNAAVEAARAGEAGAGFAVVADEVRNLAMRAAEAAKNTADLIEGTVKKVNAGGDLVSKTNEAFTEVAASTNKVGELVGEIAAASSEQAQGIGQVNTAVNEVDKVTQQNAASAEESASASEEMSAQAEQMRGFVAELTQVVGGTNGHDGGMTKIMGRLKSRKIKEVLHLSKHEAPKKETSLSVVHRATAVAPEKAIPLDNEDFENF